MEAAAKILIIVHASLGGLALLTGLLALIFTKGGRGHKLSGKIFFYSMLSSAFVALVVSALPNHYSPFLFGVGIFSSYFLLLGYFSLKYKKPQFNLLADKVVCWTMLLSGLAMIVYSTLIAPHFNVVLLVFGAFGGASAIQNLVRFKDKTQLKAHWLTSHLGNMMGGYIAAVTAFVVVNNLIPGVYGWFVPGVVGGFFIAYWTRKVRTKKR